MGVLDVLMREQVKSFSKGLCSAMLISFSAARESDPGQQLYKYSQAALECRDHWIKKQSNTYLHDVSGEEIEIEKTDSLVDVIKKICQVEMTKALEDLYPDERKSCLDLAETEIEYFFKSRR